MPLQVGVWRYRTSRNIPALEVRTGSFTCVPASGKNHGPVRVHGSRSFGYADGVPYRPFGTTAYAWLHGDQNRQKVTMQSLRKSGFNNLRNAGIEADLILFHPYDDGRWGRLSGTEMLSYVWQRI